MHVHHSVVPLINKNLLFKNIFCNHKLNCFCFRNMPIQVFPLITVTTSHGRWDVVCSCDRLKFLFMQSCLASFTKLLITAQACPLCSRWLMLRHSRCTGRDRRWHYPVLGAVLPPLVILRYCNAVLIPPATVLGGYSAVQSHSVLFVTEGSFTALQTVCQWTWRLYGNGPWLRYSVQMCLGFCNA